MRTRRTRTRTWTSSHRHLPMSHRSFRCFGSHRRPRWLPRQPFGIPRRGLHRHLQRRLRRLRHRASRRADPFTVRAPILSLQSMRSNDRSMSCPERLLNHQMNSDWRPVAHTKPTRMRTTALAKKRPTMFRPTGGCVFLFVAAPSCLLKFLLSPCHTLGEAPPCDYDAQPLHRGRG